MAVFKDTVPCASLCSPLQSILYSMRVYTISYYTIHVYVVSCIGVYKHAVSCGTHVCLLALSCTACFQDLPIPSTPHRSTFNSIQVQPIPMHLELNGIQIVSARLVCFNIFYTCWLIVPRWWLTVWLCVEGGVQLRHVSPSK